MLKDVQDSKGEVILFIDEMHTLVGAGVCIVVIAVLLSHIYAPFSQAAEGSMDASNMLKPALARGELHW